ncbi:ELM1/GtrOC1 family putative glycosyltransferase [Ancylobacter polymorphus]|uniref:Mitochondrial fission protein ELM1 n=1 Tax=Ancylobacter polymorphus TaxID=223390 RepID=A0ABU0BCS6_9HYPH|nr:ELM1/GtrOC1 family putative glycosyltransferase [Ancylobacter polymorphus]MDQ0303220.1 mitochondrial fission protein ELM1 [Ancylobacter polymorphus]
MKLLVLRDKKPGHFNQAEGVALAIERLAPTEVTRLDIRPTWFAHDDVRKFIMRRYGRDAGRWLRSMYAIEASTLEKPDVIVGSGRPTIAAGILLSRFFGGVPFVYSGGIGGYDTREVSLMIVASPRAAGNPRSAWAPIPSIVDPADYPAPRRLSTLADLKGADIALLVGGTAYRKEWPAGEWDALLRLVRDVAREYGVRWRVTTSRRTPDEVGARLAALAGEGVLAEFIDYRTAGPGSVRALFGADAVAVTEDSMSMLVEGLTAQRPVIGLRSAKVHDGYASEAISAWAAKSWAAPSFAPSLAILPLGTVNADQFARTLVTLEPPTLDVRGAIAALIAPVLGLAQNRDHTSS